MNDRLNRTVSKTLYYRLRNYNLFIPDENDYNEEQENPIMVEITDIHNKQLRFYRDENVIKELKNRAVYFSRYKYEDDKRR